MELISSETDFDDLDQILLKYSAEDLENVEYDLLQQSIISNNKNAVAYLLMKNFYSKDYHPPCNEYLHLACKLGRDTMVKMIMESRPADFSYKASVCYPNKCFHELTRSPSVPIIGLLPIDVAVSNNQMSCLLSLLHSLPQDNQINVNPAALLCNINHPAALTLLLKHGVSYEELKAAYRESLLKKRSECLELVIDTNFKDLLIRGMNPYHVLYQYSSGFNRHATRHDGLYSTTVCLLKKGLDISTYKPAGSYPLYSLLDLIMKDSYAYGEEYLSESVSRELLSCLKLILKQGVRLDLDEIQVSLSKTDEDEPIAFGRELFKSAYDVLSYNASNAASINLAASEILKHTVDLLSNQTQKVKLRSANLTGIIQLLIKSLRSKSICKNLESIIYKLLWEGADPSQPIQLPFGIGSSYLMVYLINQYIEALCKLQTSEMALQLTLNQNPVIKWLVISMTYHSLCTAIQINYRILASSESNHLTQPLINYITKVPLLRLKTLSARTVWFAIGRRREHLTRLPIPNHMKSSFLDIIVKEL